MTKEPELRFERLSIGMIVVLAFLVRICGIQFGLPDIFHQDEPIVVNHAVAFAGGDFNPHFFKIPPLLSYLLFMIYGVIFVFMKISMHFSKDQFSQLFFEDPTIFYLSGRLIFGAFLGALSVFVLYGIGKKLFNGTVALIAALFFCLNFLHVRDSHYLYVDIPMLFSLLMSFYFLNNYRQTSQPAQIGLSSFWAGVAIAFKYVAAPIVIPIAAVILSTRSEKGERWFVALFISGIIVLAAYSVLNPFQWIDLPFFLGELRAQSVSEGRMPLLHHLLYSLLNGHGIFGLTLGIIGIVLACVKEARIRWFWIFPFVYYGMITFFSQPYERYAMPLTPFLCLGAAYGVYRLTQRPAGTLRTVVAMLCIGFVILSPTHKILYLDKILAHDDTRTVVQHWFWSQVPKNSVVVLDHPFFSPRLNQTKEQLLDKISQISPKDPHAESKRKKIEMIMKVSGSHPTYRVYYVDPNLSIKNPFLSWSPLVSSDWESLKKIQAEYYIRYRYPGESETFKDRIEAHAQLVQIISPYKDPKKNWTSDRWAHVALPYENDELFSRDRPGPYLEIYKLNLNS